MKVNACFAEHQRMIDKLLFKLTFDIIFIMISYDNLRIRRKTINTREKDFHADHKYSIMHGGLLAASELNKGQTLFQDMCGRLQRGEYGQQSELALIACKYNVEIIVFENGTQQWIQKPTGTRQQKHVIALRWCRDSIHYDWLKRINSYMMYSNESIAI